MRFLASRCWSPGDALASNANGASNGTGIPMSSLDMATAALTGATLLRVGLGVRFQAGVQLAASSCAITSTHGTTLLAQGLPSSSPPTDRPTSSTGADSLAEPLIAELRPPAGYGPPNPANFYEVDAHPAACVAISAARYRTTPCSTTTSPTSRGRTGLWVSSQGSRTEATRTPSRSRSRTVWIAPTYLSHGCTAPRAHGRR